MKPFCLGYQLLFLGLLAGIGNSQDTFKSDLPLDDAIERGEDLILEVSRQRERLPNRWAAVVDYRVESTPDAEKYLLIEGSSFLSEDKSLKVKVCRRMQLDHQADGGGFGEFPMDVFDWQSKSEYLALSNNKIDILRLGVVREHLHPFMLWISGPECLSQGLKEDESQFCFFGNSRKCDGSNEEKTSRNIESIWTSGKVSKDAENVAQLWTQMRVLHNQDLKMPVELSAILFDSSVKKKDGEYVATLVRRTSARWFKNEQYDIALPTTVQANWMENGDSFEALFSVRWLFEEDVPDETFTDPRIGKIVIPKFPPSDHDILMSKTGN